MSKTDKTRPFHVKQDELRAADPYGFNRDTYQMTWRPEFSCGASCRSCGTYWWTRQQKRRERQDARRAVRDWQREY